MVYKGHVDEFVFFFQAEDGIRDVAVTGVQTCALPISWDLVIEAVKQMTAHSDVMRSDRLKQVMQEIDPAFNEKEDRKSTRLNSSHGYISYAVFCLKKKKT